MYGISPFLDFLHKFLQYLPESNEIFALSFKINHQIVLKCTHDQPFAMDLVREKLVEVFDLILEYKP